MTKSAFYEVYFTIITTALDGRKTKGKYMATLTADSKAQAIALTKAANRRRDSDVITIITAQKID